MNVAELFATLGIDVDQASFALADKALARLKHQTQTAMQGAELHTAITAVVGDTTKAMNLIGIEADKVMEGRAKRSIKWIEMLSHAMTVWRGIVAGAAQLYRGAKGVAGLVEATAAAGARADELSQSLGISAEAVQELGYAAGLSGSNTEKLAAALGKLAKGGELSKYGNKPLDQVLASIADEFAAMPDGAAKSRRAMELFGKTGAELIPLLNQGSAGIAALRSEAQEMGAVIDNNTSKALEGFGDETDKVKLQLEGLRNDAIKAVLPDLLAMVKGTQAWIKANRVEIVKAMTTAIRALLVTLRVLGAVARGVVAAFAYFHDHRAAALAAILALAAGFGFLAAGAASAWLAILGPIGAVIVAIVALAVYWEDIAAAMFAAWMKLFDGIDWVGRQIRRVVRAVRGVFNGLVSMFRGAALAVKQAFASVINWIIDKINWVTDKINWLIRQTNKILPGSMQIGTIGKIDHVLTAPKKATAEMPKPSAVSKGAGAVSIGTIGGTTINVHAPNANPDEVAAAVDNKMRTFWDRQMRASLAGSGVA
jgi:hypothetical protein